jgi:hypothetical protein
VTKIAKFISIVFHPTFQATFLTFILYSSVPELFRPFDDSSFPRLLLFVAVLTCLFPLMLILGLRALGTISSLNMPTRQERLMPFFFISLFYGLTVYFFSQRLAMNDMIVVMLIAVTILIFLIFLITIKFKISVHAAASWGVFGCLLSLNTQLPDSPLLYPIIGSVLLAGLVSSARLYLNAHTPKEVYYGLLLGFAVCFGILYFAF